jgi:hypothetical protein
MAKKPQGSDENHSCDKREPTAAWGAQKGRAEMKGQAKVSVGEREGDIRGADNRALQAAIDYIANLGGGMVEIGEGE